MEVVLIDVRDEGFVAGCKSGGFVCELGVEIVKGSFGFLLTDKRTEISKLRKRN